MLFSTFSSVVPNSMFSSLRESPFFLQFILESMSDGIYPLLPLYHLLVQLSLDFLPYQFILDAAKLQIYFYSSPILPVLFFVYDKKKG